MSDVLVWTWLSWSTNFSLLNPQKKKSKRQTLPPDTHPRLLLRSVSIGCVTLEEEFCLEDII